MKNKFTARLSVFMCLVLLISCFAACSIKDDNTETTTLAPDDSWQSGTGYDKVIISQAELVDLVEDALGDDMPENFNGDLSTLTPEQLDKVEDHAKNEGLTVEKDENGDTVIKKEEIPTQQASEDEVKDLFDRLSIKDPSNLSDEELEELSKAADDEGLIVQTKPDGEVVVVKPVTTTRIITQAPQTETTKKNKPTTTKNRTPSTTSVYKPQHMTAAPTGAIIDSTPSALSNGWVTNFSGGVHTVLVDNFNTSDGGTVAVGITSSDSGSSGVIVKYDKDGKQKWTNTLKGNALVSYDGVAELTDGSIIVVGSTMASDVATPDQYLCENTVEGLIVKYSAKGEQQWTKILGGSGADMLYAVEATSDGGFVAGGKSNSVDGSFSDLSSHKTKAFIYKFSSNGSISWRSCLAGKIHCAVIDLAINPNGDIFAVMENNNSDGDFAQLDGAANGRRIAVITKLSSDGKRAWVKSLYETGLVNMSAITFTDDGGCVVAGQYSVSAKEGNKGSFKDIYNGGTAGTFDGVIVKFKNDGSRAWTTPLIGFESDFITDITRIENGYAVSGYSASNNRDFQGMGKGNFDAYIYTLSKYGEAEKLYHYGGSNPDHARAICTNGSSLYVCGSTNSTDGNFKDMSPAPSGDNYVGVVRCYNLA